MALLREMTCNLRHPMSLRHSVIHCMFMYACILMAGWYIGVHRQIQHISIHRHKTNALHMHANRHSYSYWYIGVHNHGQRRRMRTHKINAMRMNMHRYSCCTLVYWCTQTWSANMDAHTHNKCAAYWYTQTFIWHIGILAYWYDGVHQHGQRIWMHNHKINEMHMNIQRHSYCILVY